MSTDVASRAGSSAARKARARRKAPTKQRAADSTSAAGTFADAGELLVFTIDAKTARIVKLEGVDKAGARRELSQDDKASLFNRRGEKTLEQLVARAFEAGIACVLEGDTGADDLNESLEDVELTERLLSPLIEHSCVKRLMTRDVMDRAILGTLIEHAAIVSPSDARAPAVGLH